MKNIKEKSCGILAFFVKVSNERVKYKKRAEVNILIMIIAFVLIMLTVTVGEFFRIHMLQQDVEYQLQRSVNCAVEYAMGDSYRQDKIINLNVALAESEFYTYLREDVGLDSSHRKYKDGKLVYRLHFTGVTGISSTAEFTVKGYAQAKSIFSFLTNDIRIPFKISSTNYRVD